MRNKLLKKIIIGTGSVSVGAGIVLSAPGIINSSQNKTRTNKDYISDYFANFNQIVGMEDSALDEILQDKDGNIWVATEGKGLWKSTDGSTFNQITNGIEDSWYIKSLLQDKDGNIWVGTMSRGLYKSTDGNVFTFVIVSDDILYSYFMTALLQDKDGNIWVGTVSGLYKSTDGSTFTAIPSGIDGLVHSLFQDKDGNIWASNNRLWKSTDGSTFTIIEFETKYLRTTSSFQDKDGNIWVGTQENGLLKSTNGSTFNQITNGIEDNWYITSLIQDKDGNIWVGTYEQGLYKSTDGSVFTQTTNGIGNNWNILSLMQDKDGNIWVGTKTNGLWKRTSGVTFTPGSTHNTIEEEGQTIYISDQNITVDIPPADQIIIDGDIISKTKEVTQYTFDGTESPHKIEISISGQNYIILVYVVESVEEINYVSYNGVPDDTDHTYLNVFLNIDTVTALKNNFLKGDSTLNFFGWISKNQIWNDLINKENNLWDILLSNFDTQDLENIDRNMLYPSPPSTTYSPDIFRNALVQKINELTISGQTGLSVKLDLKANIPTNFGTDGNFLTYWDSVLFPSELGK